MFNLFNKLEMRPDLTEKHDAGYQDKQKETTIVLEQKDQIEITLPVLRESSLPQIFPLSEVFVSFPTPKKVFLNTVMFYKIDFTWNGQIKSIQRRFSEIENLREAFQSLLPFSFIFPVHRKQIIVN